MCGAPCLDSTDAGTMPIFACADSKPDFCANKEKKSLSKGGSATDFCYKGDVPLIKCEKTCGYCRTADPSPSHGSSSLPECLCSAFRHESAESSVDAAQVHPGTLCFHTEQEHYGASWDTFTVCSSPTAGGECYRPGARKCTLRAAPPAPPALPPSFPAQPRSPPLSPKAVVGEEVTGQEASVKLKGVHMTYLPWLFVPPRPPSTPPVFSPPPLTPQPLAPPRPPASPPSAPPPSPPPALPCPEACYTTSSNGNNIPQWRKCISSMRRGQRPGTIPEPAKYGPRYCDACPVCYLSPAGPPSVPPPAAPPPPLPPLHPMCSENVLTKSLCKVPSPTRSRALRFLPNAAPSCYPPTPLPPA